MATRKYNIGLDESDHEVVQAVGAGIASGALQVTIDLAVVNNRKEALSALDNVRRHILENIWPPA